MHLISMETGGSGTTPVSAYGGCLICGGTWPCGEILWISSVITSYEELVEEFLQFKSIK